MIRESESSRKSRNLLLTAAAGKDLKLCTTGKGTTFSRAASAAKKLNAASECACEIDFWESSGTKVTKLQPRKRRHPIARHVSAGYSVKNPRVPQGRHQISRTLFSR
jgi:hypothetical protein